MTTLHLHLGDKNTQKECLRRIGSIPGTLFTSVKYLSQLPNSTVMMKRILGAEIFGIITEQGMDRTAYNILLEVMRKRELEGKKTVVITLNRNHLPEEISTFLAGNTTECLLAEECVQAFTTFMTETEQEA